MRPFIIKIKRTDEDIVNKIPFVFTGVGSYHIDWGDGCSDNIRTRSHTNIKLPKKIKHIYKKSGEYNISVTGDIISFYDFFSYGIIESRKSILEIVQWGDIKWKSLDHAFDQCMEMKGTFTDKPDLSECYSMDFTFRGCFLYNSNMNEWDVSKVVSLECFLGACHEYNQPMDKWDVSSVINMKSLFSGCYSFNQNIASWVTEMVETMKYMFADCKNLNQDLSKWGWDTRNVDDFDNIFSGCKKLKKFPYHWDFSNWRNYYDTEKYLTGIKLRNDKRGVKIEIGKTYLFNKKHIYGLLGFCGGLPVIINNNILDGRIGLCKCRIVDLYIRDRCIMVDLEHILD